MHKVMSALQRKVFVKFPLSHKKIEEDLADTPVVFELVQVLQEEIGYLTEEQGRGYFAFLPTDILCRIFDDLELLSLCTTQPCNGTYRQIT